MRVRQRDLAARVLDFWGIRTPEFAPSVLDPGERQIVSINAYRLWATKDARILAKKIAKRDDVVIIPESGYRQIRKYEDDVTLEEIVEIQQDAGFPVVASFPSAKVEDAITNAKLAREISGKPLLLEVDRTWDLDTMKVFADATQGWAWGYAIASEDPKKIAELARAVPRGKVIVVYGIHHPAAIPVLAMVGADIFTSGAHARYAQRGDYITGASIRPISELQELPCACPVCRHRDAEDLKSRTDLLAEHNEIQFQTEARATRNAIVEGRLFEYATRRALTHPGLWARFLEALEGETLEWILENMSFPKTASIYAFPHLDVKRPEHILGERIVQREKIPVEWCAYTYPFGQTYPSLISARPKPEHVVQAAFRIPWGIDPPESAEWVLRHGIPRKIILNGEEIGLIRFEDGFFVPNLRGAEYILSRTQPPHRRVVVDDDGVQAIQERRPLLARYVLDADPELRPNMEVIVVDAEDKVVATGKSAMTAREVAEMDGIVVKIRHRA